MCGGGGTSFSIYFSLCLVMFNPFSGVGVEEIGSALRDLTPNSRKCLGIDGNGHSPVWGPSFVELNNQGALIESLLASEELFCLNTTDSPPHFRGR